MIAVTDLPALNACLNALASVFLISGYIQIKRGHKRAHRFLMLCAVTVATLFLISYITYHVLTELLTKFPSDRYPGVAPIYYTILISHTLLAAATPVLVLITLIRAFKEQWTRHRRIARWTFPIWLYVSITGVLIYMMLYHWFA